MNSVNIRELFTVTNEHLKILIISDFEFTI